MSSLTERWVEESTQIRTEVSNDYVVTCDCDWMRQHIIEVHNRSLVSALDNLAPVISCPLTIEEQVAYQGRVSYCGSD
jgi:hypothetical protein